MHRGVLLACIVLVATACASPSTQGPKPASWKDDPSLAPPSVTQPKGGSGGTSSQTQGSGSQLVPGSAAAAAAAQPAAMPEPDIPPAQPDGVESSEDGVPGSACAPRSMRVAQLWSRAVHQRQGALAGRSPDARRLGAGVRAGLQAGIPDRRSGSGRRRCRIPLELERASAVRIADIEIERRIAFLRVTVRDVGRTDDGVRTEEDRSGILQAGRSRAEE